MARGEKRKLHYRVVLGEYTEGMNFNPRRSARGVVHVDIGEQYGEVQISVENLKYLGNALDGLPYYYEGWMILGNGFKMSMGPISTDNRGSGKSFWRFPLGRVAGTGITPEDIKGFAVTAETMTETLYPSNSYILVGSVNEKEDCLKPPGIPPIQYPLNSSIFPNPYGPNYPVWPAAEPGVEIYGYNILSFEQLPYQWWEISTPGMRSTSDLLFGYRMGNEGIERVAFGFPGMPDRPALPEENGEWLPAAEENTPGYWIYYRDPQIAGKE